MTRSTGRKDGNEKEIVDQCRKFGMLVIIQSQYRAHDFDLLIGDRGKWLIFEIKKDDKAKLTENEETFRLKCVHRGLPIHYVTSFEQIFKAFGYD